MSRLSTVEIQAGYREHSSLRTQTIGLDRTFFLFRSAQTPKDRSRSTLQMVRHHS